ncbi:MAG: hypothetical protein NC225_02855 [Clostridium sp.]|nr:hypothetical protein [Clostridium sp.]MCM1398404.1 hypothetical protein [Clostridium sp.]MCM1458931.1 hypothetical protein [Bacteroides sp.]
MSKKCCGKIYPDDAEICDICGLPIEQTSDDADEDVFLMMMEQEAQTDGEVLPDEEEDGEASDGEKTVDGKNDKASKGFKAAGIAFLSLAVIGFVLVGVCIYFMVISPYYDKNDTRFDLNYPELASNADADKIRESLDMMATPSDATISDAAPEDQEVE